jgi:hypothetical protein
VAEAVERMRVTVSISSPSSMKPRCCDAAPVVYRAARVNARGPLSRYNR